MVFNLCSRLTLNSEGGRAVSPSQVSLSTSPPIHQPGLNESEKEQKPSPRRSPMLKSYSQDPAGPRIEPRYKVGNTEVEYLLVYQTTPVLILRVSS